MNLAYDDLRKLLHKGDRKKQELIERCRSGDRQAFNQFIRQYQNRIFSYVSRMLGSDREASSITCDLFVEAYNTFPDTHEEQSLEVWLFKIARKHIQAALNESTGMLGIFSRVRQAETQEEECEQPAQSGPDELLLAYLDGELDESDAEDVEQRLQENGAYREEFDELQRTDKLLRFFSDRSAPAELQGQINAKLDEKTFWEKAKGAMDELHIGAQVPRMALPLYQGIRGPEGQEILNLEIKDGLKQFLLANLYANHGLYDIAREHLENQLAIEQEPETRRLLEYASQKIDAIKEEDTQRLDPCHEIRRQAETTYDKAEFYKKHGKNKRAIRFFLEALQLYRQIKSIEGQIIVRHQLALLYNESGHNEEALEHAREFLKLYQDLKIVQKFDQIQELLRELQ